MLRYSYERILFLNTKIVNMIMGIQINVILFLIFIIGLVLVLLFPAPTAGQMIFRQTPITRTVGILMMTIGIGGMVVYKFYMVVYKFFK